LDIPALSIINGDYPFYTSNSSIKDYMISSQSLRHFVPLLLWLRHTPQCHWTWQGRRTNTIRLIR